MTDSLLIERFLDIKQRIDDLNATHQSCVMLLAVSKTKPASDIRTLFNAGQVHFGENYLQEAVAKINELNDLPIVWHYIGHIQRNKTRDIATHFDWVETLDRGIIAKRLHEQRPSELTPLNVLIQVNIDDESSKSGCQVDELPALIDEIGGYDRLCLRGLMIIPAKDSKDAFRRTKDLFDEIGDKYDLPQWDTLSMGMSDSLADAIGAGSTLVRVGTAIFGARDYV